MDTAQESRFSDDDVFLATVSQMGQTFNMVVTGAKTADAAASSIRTMLDNAQILSLISLHDLAQTESLVRNAAQSCPPNGVTIRKL